MKNTQLNILLNELQSTDNRTEWSEAYSYLISLIVTELPYQYGSTFKILDSLNLDSHLIFQIYDDNEVCTNFIKCIRHIAEIANKTIHSKNALGIDEVHTFCLLCKHFKFN